MDTAISQSQRSQQQLLISKPSLLNSILVTVGCSAIALAAWFLMPVLYLDMIPTLLTALDDPLSLSSLFIEDLINPMIPIVQFSVPIGCLLFALRQWILYRRPQTPKIVLVLKLLFYLSIIAAGFIFIALGALLAREATMNLFEENYSSAVLLIISTICLAALCIFFVRRFISQAKPLISLALSALVSCLVYCLFVVAVLVFIGIVLLVLFGFVLLLYAITLPMLKVAS